MAINMTFVDFVTPIPADWLNNVNTVVNSPSIFTYTAPYTNAIGRTLASKLADAVDVTDFGLPATGTTLTTALASIVTAGGGSLKIPIGTSSILTSLPTSSHYYNVLIEADGPNIPVQQIQETPGSQLIAQKAFISADPGSHVGVGHTLMSLNNQVVGSGNTGITFGADFALVASLIKNNYATTSVQGEMNGIYAIIRQGGPSACDACGLLTDVAQYGNGFTAAMESVTRQYGISGTDEVVEIDFQAAVIYNGPSTPAAVGLALNATLGVKGTNGITSMQGISINSGTASVGYWDTAIQVTYNGSVPFSLDGQGNINSVASIICQGQIDGQTLQAAGPASGHTGAGLIIGSGTTTTASAGSQTLPSNPAGFMQWFFGNTLVKVPYYNA